MSWTIRSAIIDDSETLALIGSATFLETFAGQLNGSSIVSHCASEHSANTYARYFADGASAWLSEVDEGKAPIGYALLSRAMFPPKAGMPGALELKRIYVLSRFHGLGMADQLLAAVIAEAQRRDAIGISLGVFSRNARAIRFYEKNGFSATGTRRFYIGDREYDDLIMSRPV